MALDENTAGVTAKAAKSKEERKQSVLDRTEIVLAILLGVAAILTAWSTFQSAQLGSAMTAAYSEGIRVSDAASQAFNDASANDIADQALFLEFAKASQAGEEETALYIEESLMSEELAAAVKEAHRNNVRVACHAQATEGIKNAARAGVDTIEPCPNLCRPRSFGLGVHLVLEALNQFAGERRALFVRKLECLSKKLPRIHRRRLALPPNLASGSG